MPEKCLRDADMRRSNGCFGMYPSLAQISIQTELYFLQTIYRLPKRMSKQLHKHKWSHLNSENQLRLSFCSKHVQQ